MQKDWTNYEKKIARYILNKGSFEKFLEHHFEEFEETVWGRTDVFQLAKEVFEIESIVDDYENLEGFLQNILNTGWAEFHKPSVNRYGLKISKCVIRNAKSLAGWGQGVDQFVCYVVWGVNGTEILVHTSNKELCKEYL